MTKKQRILISLSTTFFIISMVLFIVLWKNIGFNEFFLNSWLETFIVAWPIAATISFFIGPVINKFFIKNK